MRLWKPLKIQIRISNQKSMLQNASKNSNVSMLNSNLKIKGMKLVVLKYLNLNFCDIQYWSKTRGLLTKKLVGEIIQTLNT